MQSELELPIPHYFISENAKMLKERDKMLGIILSRMGPQDTAVVGSIIISRPHASGADLEFLKGRFFSLLV